MAFLIKPFQSKYDWDYADNRDIKQFFGLAPDGKLPRGPLPARDVELRDGRKVPLWLEPFKPHASGRKSSKHRAFVKCPDCGAAVPAGRAHQHKCKGKKA